MISPSHEHAYWGVAYTPYLGGSPNIFFCPTTKFVDDQYIGPPNQDGLFKNGFKYISYGFNGFYSTPNRQAMGLDLAVWVAKVNQTGAGSSATQAEESVTIRILVKHSLFRTHGKQCQTGQTTPIFLGQWAAFKERVNEYYRHGDIGNIMWGDGHASEPDEEIHKKNHGILEDPYWEEDEVTAEGTINVYYCQY